MVIEREFDDKFRARSYLRTYYGSVGPAGSENYELLKFYAKEAFGDEDRGLDALEFACGPSLAAVISTSSKLALFEDGMLVRGRIDISDYKNANLKEIQEWRNESPVAHNWRPFVRKALELEGKIILGDTIARTREDEIRRRIERREDLMRKVIRDFYWCDAFKENPLGGEFFEEYPIVLANFVPESISSEKSEWEMLMQNICSLVRSDGSLVMTAIKEAAYYKVGARAFAAVSINEEDLETVLAKLGFEVTRMRAINADVTDISAKNYDGYPAMIFLRARKKIPTLRPFSAKVQQPQPSLVA